jgi:hypothetical protein
MKKMYHTVVGMLNHPSSAGSSDFFGMYEHLSFERVSKNYIFYDICNVLLCSLSIIIFFCAEVSSHSSLRCLIP